MIWSDEDKARAIDLCVRQGMSASDAGNLMGRTRNAVIGIIHRSGYKVGSANNPHKSRSRKRLVPTAPRAQRRQSKVAAAGITAAQRERLPVTIDTSTLRSNQDVQVLQMLANDAGITPPAGSQGFLRRNEDGKLEVNPKMHDRACRWPTGDPLQHPDCFCAEETVPGLPYCEHHASRAYAGTPPAKATPQARARKHERV